MAILLPTGKLIETTHSVCCSHDFYTSDQALRIKTDASASGSTVTNITYSGNVGTNLKRFGVIIDQSYPATLGIFAFIHACDRMKLTGVNRIGSPGNGVSISVGDRLQSLMTHRLSCFFLDLGN